ncbi:DNA polymerase III subunit delta' [Sphaerotilus microaerophilus]|uniref:DNA polymerase III subunit delta n=1 Tax=Sphaerotilus microaerophilus TaxID=2914710 RepID=A0ABM7YML3_9BURK|nr:DNA polymerase III subunit delta' [Sphaerotilus sp. FB-5]BDI05681.1 DNA polymerase III subunit delta' [Sphaerotilus sp. FB-5]
MVSSTRRSAPARESAASAAAAAPRPPLPWLDAPLAQVLATQRAHALLVYGPQGVGQLDFALGLARAWLCETPAAARPQGLACGHCAACHLVDERSHPDLRLIVPEAQRAEAGLPVDEAGSDDEGKKRKPSREIKVDQIRTALNFAELTAGRAAHKVLVLFPAEAINPIAANALLKTLEEPGAMRFVLASGAPQALLPTIRSRCQAVQLQMPTREEALAWLGAQGVADAAVLLDAAGGQPQAALALHAAGLDAAAWRQFPQWAAQGQAAPVAGWPLPLLIDALAKLCHDRALVTLGQPARYFAHSELRAGNLDALTRWAADLRRRSRVAEHPFSAGLAVEALMLQARL